jgi:hypothetical protein
VQIKEQLDGVLQQFDVLPSRFDRLVLKYIYIYLLGLLFLAQLLFIIALLSMNIHIGRVLVLTGGFGVLPVLALIAFIWRFHVWRSRAPQTLRDLWEHKRIALPDGDADLSYLRLLEHYREALASPKRYVLSGLLILMTCFFFAYDIVQIPSSVGPNAVVPLVVVGYLLLVCLYSGGFYCLGILTWAMYLSGWYVRNLARVFQLSIRPFHPDQCGGLKLLGNFCFGLGSPLLIASNQVEAAEAVQKHKALVETLYAPYPTWPFHVRSKISSTVLEVSGSLLIGLLTAAIWQYVFPVILTLLFHTP